MIAGITRVRNESLIIADTLEHYLKHVSHVFLYDDCSTDNTAEIACGFDRVSVICGDEWFHDRPAEETRHRKLLQELASDFEWVLCFDADERLVGELPDLSADAYRFRLFDGYLTPQTQQPYTEGSLESLDRLYGPEYRDIIMLFRNDKAVYQGRDKREPIISGRVELAETRVKHFGKCLSDQHWQETCDYYANHWPEPYKSKWAARRGKAIHTLSDFGRPLHKWAEVESHGVKL